VVYLGTQWTHVLNNWEPVYVPEVAYFRADWNEFEATLRQAHAGSVPNLVLLNQAEVVNWSLPGIELRSWFLR
jgi:hypothetical protein